MSRLTLRLFGAFEARLDGKAIPGLHLREGERLLAYLALHAETSFSYRALAQLFWPSEARVEGSNTFPSTRQAVYILKQHLGDEGERLLRPGKGQVQLSLEGMDVDVHTFNALAASESPADWERALECAAAELLEGWSEPWVLEARARRQRVCARLRQRLAGEAPRVRPVLEPTGGAVPPSSPFYILRGADLAFTEALERRDSIVLIRGARQIGKTSLLARGLEGARQRGTRVMLTDLQSLSERYLGDLERFVPYLKASLSMQLGQGYPSDLREGSGLDPLMDLELFLEQRVLVAGAAPVVWGIDELDRLQSFSFASDFFGLLRSWHNRRALQPQGPWSRLTLVLTYATEAHLLLPHLHQSLFNVGVPLPLDDFTPEQVQELNRRYGSPIPESVAGERLYGFLVGHPYLTRRALDALALGQLTLEALEAAGEDDEGPFRDHLRRLLVFVQADAALTAALRELLNGGKALPLELFYRLRSGGLIAGHSAQQVRVRCPLYAEYFRRHLAAS